MTTESNKLKLLYLEKILRDETDSIHSLTMPQIIQALEEYGVSAERKAVYRDIDRLREFGLDIVKRPTQPVSYALESRMFSSSELTLLADAVQSSRFLTKSKSSDLLRAIKSLGSKHEAKELSRRIHVEGRVKSINESAFSGVDIIQRAISSRRKIQFHYFKHDASKKRVLQHNGDLYIETPVTLVYSDDNYYVIVFNDKHNGFASYRVDRMLDLAVANEPATRNESVATFDITEYEARAFGMFSGEPVMATLTVDGAVMSSVIDRFGRDVNVFPAEGERARVVTHVMSSPTFFGWVAQFGGKIVIEKPASLRKSFAEYLARLAEEYQD